MTEHRRDFDTAAPTHRCRLCSANDLDGVIEQLADDLWESRRDGAMMDRPWAEAGAYWQARFRELAETAVANLK